MLKLLTYLVSEISHSHFSGGSYGGVRSPPTGQEAPSGRLQYYLSLFDDCFHISPTTDTFMPLL